MNEQESFNPLSVRVLVLDPSEHDRALAMDQVRSVGFRRLVGAGNIEEAWGHVRANEPQVILAEWAGDGDGLDLLRRVRTNEDSPNRAAAYFLLTWRGNLAHVESARLAGASGFLRKPIAALTLYKWVRSVLVSPRPFVVSANYVGPCRRRREDFPFAGAGRRATDAPAVVMVDDIEQRMAITRARVQTLETAARVLAPGDSSAAARVIAAARSLAQIAAQFQDEALAFGCREMLRYLEVMGGDGALEPDVVRTHVAALQQLAVLPPSMSAERDQVARSLNRMVDKKLRIMQRA